jgi:hypothetical protein
MPIPSSPETNEIKSGKSLSRFWRTTFIPAKLILKIFLES